MFRGVTSFKCVKACAWALCAGIVFAPLSHAQQASDNLIVLDPTCLPLDSRNPPLAPGNPAPSTKKMAERLAALLDDSRPEAISYRSDQGAAALEKQVAQAHDLKTKLSLQFSLAQQQAQAGRPDNALNTYAAMERSLQENRAQLDEQTMSQLRMRKAIAYMRLGEQENCLGTRNADSCIFPLRPPAFHLLPRGSRGAISLFEEELGVHPRNLNARWLLNLACMTLGEYPAKVPGEYLISPQAFASEYPMEPFREISGGLGLDVDSLAGGVIVDDFDNDGWYDIVVSAWDLRGQIRFFRNNGDGSFTQRTSEAGLVGLTCALHIQQTDYNNDGLLDIWMLRGGWLGRAGRIPNSLLRNNGDGTFTDVTEEAGLLSFHPTQTSVWFDYDGDGWLDLFIGNESTDPKKRDWSELYHNNRNGTFTECAQAAGLRIAAMVKGVTCADYDNDGRPDLYLSVRNGTNYLFHNEGPSTNGQWSFSDTTAKAGVGQPVYSFPTWFFDYDNDGWEDLFVAGYYLPHGVADIAAEYLGIPSAGTKPKLYHNNGNGTFSDVTERTHLNRICHTMGCNYGDLDNDGWLDFYCATGDPDLATLIPNRMFRNAGGQFFQDVSAATRTGHLQKGHGVAFADLDGDGAQDVYAVLGGAFTGDTARNALFLNPGTTNHWLKLKLTGTQSNRVAIGARIKVSVRTPEGARTLYRTVSSGASFGANPLRQEIGLANATRINTVEVRWPGSNHVQTFTGLEMDHGYELREDRLKADPVRLKRIQLEQKLPSHGPNPS